MMDSNNNYQYQGQAAESQAVQRAKAEQSQRIAAIKQEKERKREKCLANFAEIKENYDAATKNGLNFVIKATNKSVIKDYYYHNYEYYISLFFIPLVAYFCSFFFQFSSLFIYLILIPSLFFNPSRFVKKNLKDLDCEKEELKIIENQIFPRKQGELKELFIISTVLFIISNIIFYYSKVILIGDKITINLQSFNPENELFAITNFVAIAILLFLKSKKRN